MSLTGDALALAVMDDDGFGCAITSAPEPPALEIIWHWPAGKTFGELSPADRAIASRQAARQLQAELERIAPAISAIMKESE
jgi:hypothetical protein